MNNDIMHKLNSILIDITDKITTFLPDDFIIKLILATVALVIVFGFVNLLYDDQDEKDIM